MLIVDWNLWAGFSFLNKLKKKTFRLIKQIKIVTYIASFKSDTTKKFYFYKIF